MLPITKTIRRKEVRRMMIYSGQPRQGFEEVAIYTTPVGIMFELENDELFILDVGEVKDLVNGLQEWLQEQEEA